MDFELLFEALCANAEDARAERITKDERRGFVQGVFSTLEFLGLRKQYDEWCINHDILIVETPIE